MQEQDELFVVTALAKKYPIFAPSTIKRWVAKESDRYAGAPIQTYIPVLVQRSVDATLSELARAEGTSADLLTLAPLESVDVGSSTY